MNVFFFLVKYVSIINSACTIFFFITNHLVYKDCLLVKTWFGIYFVHLLLCELLFTFLVYFSTYTAKVGFN